MNPSAIGLLLLLLRGLAGTLEIGEGGEGHMKGSAVPKDGVGRKERTGPTGPSKRKNRTSLWLF